MLDIPSQAPVAKGTLIGGCRRLPLQVDANRLLMEVSSLPSELWGSQGGRVGVHSSAEAIFLRGHAPAEGELAVEDRPALTHLPYVRHLIFALIPATPMRCLLAKLGPGASISPHIDQAPYFGKTLRLHIPILTNPQALMYCAGHVYRMAAGEVWALNNSAVHAVWNRHPELHRTHVICDFLPSPGLMALLARADKDLGEFSPDFERLLLAGGPAGTGS